MQDDKIVMLMDDGSEVEFTILESTILGGVGYILVTDAPDDEDGDCYVMKDVSGPDDEEAIYESVEDDDEYEAVFNVFSELLDGEIDIEK
ncbi:MAG: DUF1292 domain-containing protein [Eubacteriales bacterium]|nr:DUF1292 domain-containing protein [Eubacteriales bacterium]